MMRKIVPFWRVVPTLRRPSSATPSLLAGKPSVVQMLTAVAPGRPDAACFATSSIFTIALPLASCPVITRRTCSAMTPSWMSNVRLAAHDSPATAGASYTQRASGTPNLPERGADMGHGTLVFLYTTSLFVGMLLCLEIGRRLGLRRLQEDSSAATEGIGAVDGAVFAVLGLLIAFTFSGATARFDARRQLIVEETNNIGTAYLRLDALPADAQPALRESFKRYLDNRIETYRKVPDLVAVRASLARGNELQLDIWGQAVAAVRMEGALPGAPMLVLPALNAMIDITTTRTMAAYLHPPPVVFVMLIGMALAASLLAGYGMTGGKLRSRFHMVGFAAVMAIAVFVILDIEFPRLGWIRVDAFDQALVDLRESMNRAAPAPVPR